MFKWLSNVFSAQPQQKLSDVAPGRVTPQKTVTKDGVGFAPKIEPVITEVKVKKEKTQKLSKIEMSTKKVVKEVKAEKVTKASLSKLTKVKLEEFALATYGVDIDKRKKKDELVKEVLKLSKKV